MLLELIRGTGTHFISSARLSGLILDNTGVELLTNTTPTSEIENQLTVDLTTAPGKSGGEEREEPRTSEGPDFVIATTAINVVAEGLCERKRKLEMIQAAESSSRMWLSTVDPTTSDRFSRAETAAERRMYRAFAALLTLRGKPASNLLPEPKDPK